MRKIIKIENINSMIFALCNDDTIWLFEAESETWKEMPQIPQVQISNTTEDHRYSIPVTKLELSTRSKHVLAKANITTIGQLVAKGRQGLLSLPLLGLKSVHEIEQSLLEFGITF